MTSVSHNSKFPYSISRPILQLLLHLSWRARSPFDKPSNLSIHILFLLRHATVKEKKDTSARLHNLNSVRHAAHWRAFLAISFKILSIGVSQKLKKEETRANRNEVTERDRAYIYIYIRGCRDTFAVPPCRADLVVEYRHCSEMNEIFSEVRKRARAHASMIQLSRRSF